MEKIKKIISIITIFILISYCLISIIIQNKSLAAQTINADINGINTSKYPGIKDKIQNLQNTYPNWTVKILYTGLDWNEVIAGEYTGHGSSPKNLVYKTSKYQGEWICPICGERDYDTGGWRCTSIEAIKYMMDPRCSLNSTDIFQFEELTNTGCNISGIQAMTNGTFLQGHEQGIIDAANNNNINAYYIVARLIQEQGKGGTEVTSGAGYNGQYVGYYNAFNIAASGNSTAEVMVNELIYAQRKGWTSLDASINGGINFLASEYIQKGQNTMYLQKFNVTDTDTYANQYMQNILAAENEGLTLRNTYINTGLLSSPHTFIIPVFENMPTSDSSRPSTTGTSTATLENMVKVNVDSTLKLRDAPNGTGINGWVYKDEVVTRLEKATSKVGGTYWDKVRKSDGTEGYAARETYDYDSEYKLYLVPLYEETTNPSDDDNSDITTTDKVKINKSTNIITVTPDAIAYDILNAFGNYTTKITKADGSFLNGGNDSLCTTFIVEDKYTVIKRGDCSGDGTVDARDAARILKYSVGQYNLVNAYFTAVDLNGDGTVDARDAARILKYSVGQYKIQI